MPVAGDAVHLRTQLFQIDQVFFDFFELLLAGLPEQLNILNVIIVVKDKAKPVFKVRTVDQQVDVPLAFNRNFQAVPSDKTETAAEGCFGSCRCPTPGVCTPAFPSPICKTK